MEYRLGLDVGSTSIGWSIYRLEVSHEDNRYQPVALIRTGVRIFPDGRDPQNGKSLAVKRREVRSARRRRDRLLQRKNSMLRQLTILGFFPEKEEERALLVQLDPYLLRAKGLDEQLSPAEFGRALFHINQRRGFKSNRKTDKVSTENGVMKQAINVLKSKLSQEGARTVGEYLYQRHVKGLPTRSRLKQWTTLKANGKNKLEKAYDFYIERSMVEDEFEALWEVQSRLNPQLYTQEAHDKLKHILLFQRPLKPVSPGRCVLLSEQPRAAKALPLYQYFRIYQDVNHLRYYDEQHNSIALTKQQRDVVVHALIHSGKRTFDQIRKLLDFSGSVIFTIEDEKRKDLDGDKTAAILSKKDLFGKRWFEFSFEQQNQIVEKLLSEENEQELVAWLETNTGVSPAIAEALSVISLPDGYGNLCQEALERILNKMRENVVTYSDAMNRAGFVGNKQVLEGAVLDELPYYGKVLESHVGFGTYNPEDIDEVRYGRIGNPTVHIGLNQLRLLINSLIKEYGHPTQIVVELARDLKMSNDAKSKLIREQAEQQRQNDRRKKEIAQVIGKHPDQVTPEELQKMKLWEELAVSPLDRCCPYTGERISITELFSPSVEIEHILPFSRTLDDSLNNKTVSMHWANQAKTNKTPYEAFGHNQVSGIRYEDVLNRVKHMKKEKRYRFSPDAYDLWLKNDKDFIARALTDTQYFSRIAKEYIDFICRDTWVTTGRLTGLLRAKLGLNDILDEINHQKNRHDHRHHAVDACVIGIIDRSTLQKFANANKAVREYHGRRLVKRFDVLWPTFREQVKRAVGNIYVSFKPDHSYEGSMHNDTAYGLGANGRVHYHKVENGTRQRVEETLNVIPMTCKKASKRHGYLEDGSPKPYKGYKGDSNYCMEIFKGDNGRWESQVVTTYEAYQIVRKQGVGQLRHKTLAQNGRPLIMRLMRNDMIRMEHNGELGLFRVCKMAVKGDLSLAPHNEANVDARNRDVLDEFKYISKRAGSLQKAKTRQVSVSVSGRLRDLGFKG